MDKQKRIVDIKSKLRYLEQHRSFLQELQFQLHDLEKLRKEKEDIFIKENQDVKNLKKVTISSLFYTIMGNKENQIDKEKQEAMEATLNYRAICNDYDLKQSLKNYKNDFLVNKNLFKNFKIFA